ncbi:FUSC family protein [Mycolicibacterium duvalii]|uniref:Fusaric acid resistance protein n=1 Tax=Mycolicibacterium duvalii TaxID=39688 RepID=A0A7I7K5B2_9MYCO|nr:FUSC family protein [Mycolicibacterium duvalii]MCV7368785.1 FUSC family protein [Mycolicibacterium duvalii]PEG44294.1 FUSC family protein [Mycolicibacterium duvalii]BBX19320.1 fusaric acid resistance protein [Mycolicibacterium duvalii]
MPGRAVGWRTRVSGRLQQRDPDRDALRRAIRAAVVVPLAAAVSFAVAGDSAQTPLFTLFGSVALLVFSDFPGNRQNRALAYAGLGLNGFVLITVGTLVAPYAWPAVLVMFVLGVVVTFSGVLSETVAAGQRATLLTFVLPACTPVGPIDERLLGWAIALAICVPAALFVLAPRHHGQLRRRAARACQALADRLDGRASSADVTAAMDALRRNFLGADFRPVGLSAGSRALVRVVDDLEWVAERAGRDTGVPLRDKAAVVAVLRSCAAVLRISRRARRDAARADLDDALTTLRTVAQGRWREDLETILGADDDEQAVQLGRALLQRRTVAATVGATGRIIAAAAAADARPVWARAFGLRLPPTGASDRLLPAPVAVAQITTGFVANRAVALRNALRTGLGLAAAVAVTHVFPLEHGFWVVLGALSVLRSSALTTGTRVWRAMFGTGIGFLLGAVLIGLVGVDPAVLWVLMPLAVFGSSYVPEIASFTAAQAAFTMMVLIFFNLIAPTGWQVGLIRVEDVIVGALVGVTVSLLLWPRGAAAAVTRAIDSARGIFVRYLRVAVLRITRGAFEERADEVAAASHQAMTASRVIDDAVRQYLSESSGETDFRAPVVRSFNRALRLRGVADLIADIPTPPPLGAYPAVRQVLESHTDALYERVCGTPDPDWPAAPISDEFVRALRSEVRDDDLGVAAALPLLTVAALLGELELIYPRPEPSSQPAPRVQPR